MGYTSCLGNSLELTQIIQRWFCVSTALLDKVWPHSPGWPYILFYFLHLFILGTGEEQVVACVCTQVYTSLCVCVQVCVQGDSLRVCSLLSQGISSGCQAYPGLELLVFSLHIPSVGIIMHVPSLKVPLSAKTVIILHLLSNCGMLFI